MAITQLNRGPDAGQIFGRKLGEGIESGIEALLNQKITDMNKRRLGEKYEALGYPKELGWTDSAFAKQYASGLDTQRNAEKAALNEAPFLEELAKRYNDALETDFITPGLLQTKQGKDFVDQIVKAKFDQEKIEAKAASQPVTLGEALLTKFGKTPDRIKKQKTILDKIGAKKKVKANDIFTPEEIQTIRKEGFDPEEVAQKIQKEHVQSTRVEQSATQQKEANTQNNEGQGGILPYITSGGIGALKGLSSLSPAFLPQTIAGAGLGLTNLIGNLLGNENNTVPSYSDIQQAALQPQDPRRMQAIEEGFASPNFLARQGAADLAEMSPAVLPPTASQAIGAGQELTRGTPLEKYAIPQNATQQLVEDIADMTALGATGGGLKGIGKGLAKAIGSEAAGFLAEHYTGSEPIGKAVKIGTFVASNIFPGTFRQLGAAKRKEFEKGVLEPAEREGLKIDMRPYDDKLRNMQNRFNRIYPSGQAREKLDEAIFKTRDLMDTSGKADPRLFMNTRQQLMDGYNEVPASARYDYQKIIDAQNDILTDFGKNINPAAANSLKESNALFRAMHETQKVKDSIISKIPTRQLGLPALLYFTGAGWGPILGSAGASYLGVAAAKALNNPVMRSSIKNAFNASAKGNSAAFSKYLDKADDTLQKTNPELYSLLEEMKAQSK